MTALSLKQVVAEALAEIGINDNFLNIPRGKPRSTTWLGVEHGFGIRHYRSGRNVYIVQTRMAGRLRTVTLGSAAVLTRAQATKVARVVIAYAHIGQDPASERQRIRAAPRFDDYLAEYWQKWSPRWKPSTARTNEIYRAQYLDLAFHGIFIDELNEADVTKWFAEINNRMGPGGSNRALAMLNHMLNKAENWGYRLENTNPCRAVRLNKSRKCERFLTTPELARLGEVLTEARAGSHKVMRVAATAISLLLLTGCRHSEVLNLKWAEVHGNRLKLNDSKTGPRTVWLGEAARALIDSLPRRKTNPWLFWNARIRRPLCNVTHYWREIRDLAGLPGVRIHDLRHTFASHAAMKQETLPMIGRLLGHVNPRSTARYAHLDDDHVLDAAQQIGDVIERMMGGG
jgi:integrase